MGRHGTASAPGAPAPLPARLARVRAWLHTVVERAALAAGLGVGTERIVIADDKRLHTVSLVAALSTARATVRPGATILLVAAGAGVTAGAALYRL